MHDVINVYKPLGWTPLQALTAYKKQHPELESLPLTYAGRLDPAAEGVLLLLKGDAIKEKGDYLHLDKTYEATILFGFDTDTYDILGMPIVAPRALLPHSKIEAAFNQCTGSKQWQVPPYSSVPVQGKPLFQWAREGRLGEITIPSKESTVYDISLHAVEIRASKDLREYIIPTIDLVTGDFRQVDIKNAWLKLLDDAPNTFTTATITVNCASGTYIRGLAHYAGQQLATAAILLSLKRTKIGSFPAEQSIKLK